ncbi:MAG: hypothetical protein IKH78_08990 [Ruminococcus sp.]|nr:hypothetical protein [Ruminococcus sp.]
MKKKIIIFIASIILIITSIVSFQVYSKNKLKRYLKSQNYSFVTVNGALANKKEIRVTLWLDFSAFEHEDKFATEVQRIKNDIEKYLDDNYHDALPSIPKVKITINNNERADGFLFLSNYTGSAFQESGEYASKELKIECGYIFCSGMNISSFSCIDGFKYLRFKELKGIDYASALNNMKDLQYLEIESKENLNDIDTDKIKEQHPNCKIVLIDAK